MLKQIDELTGKVLRAVPITCFAALFVLLFVNVVTRTAGISGFAWFDEIVQGLFAWMVFVGAAALWRERDHFQVDWLPSALPPRGQASLGLLTSLLAIGFLGCMTWFGLHLTLNAGAVTPILKLPTSLFYLCIPVSGAVMLVYSLADLVCLIAPPLSKTETS